MSLDELRKWQFLQNAPKNDAQAPEVQTLAANIREIARITAWPDWTFAYLALSLARDCIKYQLDSVRVSREQIDGFTDPPASPLLPLIRGVDDCDAKARLFCALCTAGGIEAEMVPRWKGDELAHVYARVRLPMQANRFEWRFVETILRRATIGEESGHVPKEVDTGKWLF
jgi:transglutaminase-like putative cysteine protease